MSSDKHYLSFFSSSLSLVILFVASAVPIPLYGLFVSESGLTYQDLSLSAVVYFIGALLSLLLLGRISDYLGRKISTLIALLLGAIGCLSMLHVDNAAPLLFGRFLQGLSCGLASSAVASWIVDTSKKVPSWIAPVVVSCGPMTGLTIGGLGSGSIIEHSSDPRILPFETVITLMVAAMILVALGKETVTKKAGVINSMRPKIGLPDSAKKVYPTAAITFVCTWALGGFFQAFGPAMAHEQLNSSSAIAGALVFASVMAPSVLGASIASRFKPIYNQIFGMLVFALSIGVLLISLKIGTLSMFLVASVVAGTAQGAILSGSISSMVRQLATEERASTFSVIYLTSYTGAAVPTLIAGQFSSHFSLLQVACAYGVLAGVGCILVILNVLRQR